MQHSKKTQYFPLGFGISMTTTYGGKGCEESLRDDEISVSVMNNIG